jgi:hypothetical protein
VQSGVDPESGVPRAGHRAAGDFEQRLQAGGRDQVVGSVADMGAASSQRLGKRTRLVALGRPAGTGERCMRLADIEVGDAEFCTFWLSRGAFRSW